MVQDDRIFLVGIEMGGFHYPTVQLYSVCGLECEELFARHIQPRHLLLQLLIVNQSSQHFSFVVVQSDDRRYIGTGVCVDEILHVFTKDGTVAAFLS